MFSVCAELSLHMWSVGEIPEVQNILTSSDMMSYVPCMNVRPDKVWIRAVTSAL